MTDEFDTPGGAMPSAETADAEHAPAQPGPAHGSAEAETVEDAAASEQTDGGDAAAPPGEAPKRPNRGVQKRIDELVRQRESAARERDYWRETALRQGKPPRPDSGAVPHASNTQDSYPITAGDPPTDMGLTSGRETVAQPPPIAEPDRLRAAEALQAFESRMRDACGRHDDFDEIALDRNLPVNEAMMQVIVTSTAGPDILYHLGMNPREAQRISRLDPLAAAHELGRVEGMLSMPPPRKITGAPPPVRPVSGSEVPVKDPRNMTYEEYRRWRDGK